MTSEARTEAGGTVPADHAADATTSKPARRPLPPDRWWPIAWYPIALPVAYTLWGWPRNGSLLDAVPIDLKALQR